jgi:hypothetical protein
MDHQPGGIMFRILETLKALTASSFLLASLTVSSNSLQPMTMDVPEGYDQQSPQEIEAARQKIERDFAGQISASSLSVEERERILSQYAHLDPKREVPTDLLEQTVLYFEVNKSRFPNQAYITIVDFSKRSNIQRFYLIDMVSGEVTKHWTTHGLNSDKNKDGFAESFGNVNGSGKSSLGFVRTAEVYSGKFKRSIRLDGLDSTNSNIRRRAIVFHGWDGVKEEPRIQGLSWGCITLDWNVKDAVLDKIKEGSLMFVGISKAK